jgi:hypothetical protein
MDDCHAIPARHKGCGHKGLTVEKKMTGPGMQQWNKRPRWKMAAMSEEGEDIWQDLLEDRRAGD